MKITITYSENNTIADEIEASRVAGVSNPGTFDSFRAANTFLREAALSCPRGVGGYEKTGFVVDFSEEAGEGFEIAGRVELRHPADGYDSVVTVLVKRLNYTLQHPELIAAEKRELRLEDTRENLSLVLEQVDKELGL